MQVSKAELVRSICRESYYEFVKAFWPTQCQDPFIDNWHIKYVCDRIQYHLERLIANKPREADVLCNEPPGTSKTTIFSVMSCPWLWTRMPHARVLGSSYAENVALLIGLKARDVVRSDLYQAAFPEVQVRDDVDRKGLFMTTKGGLRMSVGVGTIIQGLHFHLLGQDDPIDPAGALSRADLAAVSYWNKQTYADRKTDKMVSVSMTVMQRLSQGDPSDEMMERDDVEHICLPATTEFAVKPTCLVNNYKDGLLDPVRLPKHYLDQKRLPQNLTEAGYAAQYGQTPIPLGGGKFDTSKLRFGQPPPEFKRVVRSWDKAVTPQKGGGMLGRQPDWTAGTKIAVDHADRVWVLNVNRFRKDSYTREEAIRTTARTLDGIAVPVIVEEEPGAGGKDSADLTARNLLGFRVKFVKASGSKEARADAFSYAVNAGNVYLPESMRQGNAWTGWAKAFVDELAYFPTGKFDDQVDSASLGYSEIARPMIEVGAI